jgi:ribosomal protein S18 acetylase RimI-like enzyme
MERTPPPGACELREAGPELAAKVYAASHGLWGAGLSESAYRGMWLELAALPWARKRFRLIVWTDDGHRVLSSAKVYRPRIRIGSSRGDACGIGAVFTPVAHRGKGHARAMLLRVLAEAGARGDEIALLFSDIAPRLYESLGFRALEAEEAVGSLRRSGERRGSALRMRPLRDADLPEVRAAQAAAAGRRTFAVERDAEHWRFLLARSEAYFRRFDGSDTARRFRVAERDGSFVGYLAAVETDDVWDLREVGAAGDDPETLAAVARAGAQEARDAGMRTVRGWFPKDWRELLPEWGLRFRPRTHAVPMIRPIAADPALVRSVTADGAFIPYLDQF